MPPFEIPHTFGKGEKQDSKKAPPIKRQRPVPLFSRFIVLPFDYAIQVCGNLVAHSLFPPSGWALSASLRVREHFYKMSLALLFNAQHILLVLPQHRRDLGRHAAAARVLRHGPKHHRSGGDDDAVPDRNVAQHRGARRHQDAAAQLWVPVPALFAVAAQSHALHDDDVVAQLGRLANHHAGPAREVEGLGGCGRGE